MKYLLIAFCMLFLSDRYCVAQAEIEHKVYSTEFGRFDIWLHEDQITGSYEIAPKNIIGSFFTQLEGQIAKGRWTDPDGSGDIELTFENGFKKFKADYRSDENPDVWYRDQWHGILQTRQESPCSSPSSDLIKPFIGIWEEFELNNEDEEEFIGTLQVQLAAGGCALVQRFISVDSTFSYATQGYVNPGSGFWEEKYVFSNGSTADYQWIIDAGDIVQRKVNGTRQMDKLHQLRFTQLNKTGYLLLQEQSSDGGRTWEVTGRTRVKRKP